MSLSSPSTSIEACSGILSIFTGRSAGNRAGMTRRNVATVIEIRIRPMIAM